MLGIKQAAAEVTRRGFLSRTAALFGGAFAAIGLPSVVHASNRERSAEAMLRRLLLDVEAQTTGPFTLDPLPYDENALEPYIDGLTMFLHYRRHHQGYVSSLNGALQSFPELQALTIEDLLRNLSSLPDNVRGAVRNNGGGHYNHTIFWQMMSPTGGGEPADSIGAAIATTFGSFGNFKDQFGRAALNRFGSGWAWLVKDEAGALSIVSTANQDTPLSNGQIPLLGIDVWEHAYYLSYQNRRSAYIDQWWNVVNWAEVERRFTTL